MQEESHFLIVGLGLLGGSYAQGLKRKGFHVARWTSIGKHRLRFKARLD
ncbi:MAG: hypothetical protein ACLSFJ_02125 [Holdemania filiformis]